MAATLLLWSLSNTVHAQSPAIPRLNDRITAPSPNAAALGVYGQAPVNLSTGQLNYEVPLYELNYHDIRIPVSLSYNYQGLKPNEHPTWVGLGWTLNAGGVITRIKHGEADERVVAGNCASSFTNYQSNTDARSDLSSMSPASTPAATYNRLIQRQNLFGINCTNGSANASNYFDSEPDEFLFNFNGYTGKFVYDNASGNFIITTNSNEVFNISVTYSQNLPYSSTITLANYISKFTITTFSGYKYEFGGSFYDHNLELFLGPPSGTYLAGGSNIPTDKGNCLYSSSWYLAKITSPEGAVATFNYGDGGIAAMIVPAIDMGQVGTVKRTNFKTYSIPVNTIVYLKEIVAGTRKISFASDTTCKRYVAANFQDVEAQEEETPDYPGLIGTTLATTYTNIMAEYNNLYGTSIFYYDHNMYVTVKNNWRKLNDITVTDANTVTDAFHLDYYRSRIYNTSTPSFIYGESATGRLELSAVTRKGYNSPAFYPYYAFSYYGQRTQGGSSNNPYDKYAYGTRKVDHWGFYNGNDELGNPSYSQDTTLIDIVARGPAYRTSRDAGPYPQDGTLTRITYPTGGYSQIEYEPNDYGKRVEYNASSNAISVISETGNKKAGGFRVKSVTNYPNVTGSVPVKKTYTYTTTPGGGVSSGVLNSGYPDYFIDYGLSGSNAGIYGNATLVNSSPSATIYKSLSNTALLPNFFEGNFLIYSKVIESAADNSYKLYEYSNSDVSNQYLDNVVRFSPFTSYWRNSLQFNWFVSKASERGQLLKESFFKAGATTPEKVISYAYNDDPGRFNSKVNFMKRDGQQLGCNTNQFSVRSYLSSYYAYHGFLKSKTETDYFGGQPVTVTTSYTYDWARNLTTQSTSYNTGTQYFDNYSYITATNLFNPGTGGDDLVRSVKYLRDNNLYRYPIEQTSGVTRNGTTMVTSGKIYTYKADAPVLKAESVLEPDAPVSGFNMLTVSGSTANPNSNYRMNTTNVLAFSPGMPYPQTVDHNGLKTAVIRDYNQEKITASVKNAAYPDIAYTSFEGTYTNAPADANKGNWDFALPAIVVTDGMTGTRSLLLNSSALTSGMLQAGKAYILSYWSKNGTVNANVSFTGGLTTGISNNGWQFRTGRFIAQGGNIQLTGTGLIDEVRMYPEGAGMETYAYNISGEMTDQGDARGILTKYEYDDQHRLVLIRDTDGNIVKKYEYGIQDAD